VGTRRQHTDKKQLILLGLLGRVSQINTPTSF
jgi:hypothetical protein